MFFMLLIVVVYCVVVQVNGAALPFSQVVKATLACPCNAPQPRLIHLDELEEAKPNVLYIPMAVLVHRCERSGGYCKKQGEFCSAASENEVSFTVEESSARGKPKAIFTLTNHTSCECSAESVRPRRSAIQLS